MPSLGSHVYSKISLLCIEGTDRTFSSGHECAVDISLELFSFIDVMLSCAQKVNYHIVAGLSVISMF